MARQLRGGRAARIGAVAAIATLLMGAPACAGGTGNRSSAEGTAADQSGGPLTGAVGGRGVDVGSLRVKVRAAAERPPAPGRPERALRVELRVENRGTGSAVAPDVVLLCGGQPTHALADSGYRPGEHLPPDAYVEAVAVVAYPDGCAAPLVQATVTPSDGAAPPLVAHWPVPA